MPSARGPLRQSATSCSAASIPDVGIDREDPAPDASPMTDMRGEAVKEAFRPPFLDDPRVRRARRALLERDEWIVERQMELTAIPAPPFGEGPRAERMMELLREVGLTEIHLDNEGNVVAAGLGSEGSGTPASGESDTGWIRETAGPVIVSAHLDTVFPPETDVTPRRVGDRILSPGISDDGRGLAALLALAWVSVHIPLPPLPPLLFVATVGEEGAGDLRGVRHLFREGGAGRLARGFISLDGVGLDRVINEGVGSTRLRVRVAGPGGHSWTDWGSSNPVHILGRVISAVDDLSLPADPRTTATVARFGGGKSINAIPEEGWLEVDLRSRDQGELERLEERVRGICRREVDRKAGAEGESNLHIQDMGRRPAGSTPEEDDLVQAARNASSELGVEVSLAASSTDANLPMSLSIPAITMGAGGRGGGIHTLQEWYSNEEGPEGILRALLALLYLGPPERP